MLRQEIYVKVSEEFGTAVGMATGMEVWDSNTQRITDSMRTNGLVYESIRNGTYQKVRREVIRLERVARRGIKELTIYKKAIKGDTTTAAKSTKVLQRG